MTSQPCTSRAYRTFIRPSFLENVRPSRHSFTRFPFNFPMMSSTKNIGNLAEQEWKEKREDRL